MWRISINDGIFYQKTLVVNWQYHSFEQNLISDTEISNLQNLEYSKEQFDSNFEILRSIDKGRLDDNGYPRYYKDKYFNGNYYLTNDWYERQWDKLLAWLDKIGYKY